VHIENETYSAKYVKTCLSKKEKVSLFTVFFGMMRNKNGASCVDLLVVCLVGRLYLLELWFGGHSLGMKACCTKQIQRLKKKLKSQ